MIRASYFLQHPKSMNIIPNWYEIYTSFFTVQNNINTVREEAAQSLQIAKQCSDKSDKQNDTSQLHNIRSYFTIAIVTILIALLVQSHYSLSEYRQHITRLQDKLQEQITQLQEKFQEHTIFHEQTTQLQEKFQEHTTLFHEQTTQLQEKFQEHTTLFHEQTTQLQEKFQEHTTQL